MEDCKTSTTAKFFFEYVLTQIGCPNILMSDTGTHLLNEMIVGIMAEVLSLMATYTDDGPQIKATYTGDG